MKDRLDGPFVYFRERLSIGGWSVDGILKTKYLNKFEFNWCIAGSIYFVESWNSNKTAM